MTCSSVYYQKRYPFLKENFGANTNSQDKNMKEREDSCFKVMQFRTYEFWCHKFHVDHKLFFLKSVNNVKTTWAYEIFCWIEKLFQVTLESIGFSLIYILLIEPRSKHFFLISIKSSIRKYFDQTLHIFSKVRSYRSMYKLWNS